MVERLLPSPSYGRFEKGQVPPRFAFSGRFATAFSTIASVSPSVNFSLFVFMSL